MPSKIGFGEIFFSAPCTSQNGKKRLAVLIKFLQILIFRQNAAIKRCSEWKIFITKVPLKIGFGERDFSCTCFMFWTILLSVALMKYPNFLIGLYQNGLLRGSKKISPKPNFDLAFVIKIFSSEQRFVSGFLPKNQNLHKVLPILACTGGPKKNFTKFNFRRHFCYKNFSFWTTFNSGILPKNQYLQILNENS